MNRRDLMHRQLDTMYSVGAAIAAARSKRGWSQQQTADRAGVSRSWLAQVELGKPAFDFRRVLLVFNTLGLRLEVNDGE
ncbi:MAG: helix-turn-helix domain-containing protein [Pseudoclavibacter sp.]